MGVVVGWWAFCFGGFAIVIVVSVVGGVNSVVIYVAYILL